LAALSKVVFSATLSEPLSWANTQLVAQDPVDAVREMKDKAATPMRTIGSRTFDGRIQLLEYVPAILAGPPGTHTGSA
jgi:hypothetical protein